MKSVEIKILNFMVRSSTLFTQLLLNTSYKKMSLLC